MQQQGQARPPSRNPTGLGQRVGLEPKRLRTTTATTAPIAYYYYYYYYYYVLLLLLFIHSPHAEPQEFVRQVRGKRLYKGGGEGHAAYWTEGPIGCFGSRAGPAIVAKGRA